MKSFILIAISLACSISMACIHFPEGYEAGLAEGRKEIFLFHDSTNAHMIIRTTLSAKKFPSEIALVLPFPSLPSRYEEVSSAIFDELAGFFATDGLSNSDFLGESPKGIKVHKTVKLEHYVIQPIEILHDDSADEFNSWLKKNKFNPMPKANQQPYLKKGAVFLAIRMKMSMPNATDLTSQPLHIVYKADELNAPIKFTHNSRTFDLDLYVFSKKQLKTDLTAQYLQRDGSIGYKKGQGSPELDKILGGNTGFVTKFSATELNTPKKSLKGLRKDPSFALSEL